MVAHSQRSIQSRMEIYQTTRSRSSMICEDDQGEATRIWLNYATRQGPRVPAKFAGDRSERSQVRQPECLVVGTRPQESGRAGLPGRAETLYRKQWCSPPDIKEMLDQLRSLSRHTRTLHQRQARRSHRSVVPTDLNTSHPSIPRTKIIACAASFLARTSRRSRVTVLGGS